MGRKMKLLIVTLATGSLISMAGGAQANPVQEFCEDSPRDGKAVWYWTVCKSLGYD